MPPVIAGVFAVVLAEIVERQGKDTGGKPRKDMAFDKGEFESKDNMQRNGGDNG